MKQIFLLCMLLPLSATLATSSEAVSSTLLSPALRHLAEDTCMIRSGLVTGEIAFTSDDFERGIGCETEAITITALPPSTDGTLYYGTMPVSVNQTLRLSGVSQLRFVPMNGCTESSFRFKTDSEYSLACILRYTDSVNASPIISTEGVVEAWTQQDIATYGTLSATDPDGDALTFEIVRYPAKGIIEIMDASTGDYRYTPCNGLRGEDSFVYTVRDTWGNYAEEATVVIDIDKAAADLVFADMTDHWAYNAALVMAAEGAMELDASGGLLYFHPEEKMSREDFLMTVMKSQGSGEIEPCSTIFADDSAISTEASGYIARAYDLGIIQGADENGSLCYKPKEVITRAEAAVILNNIIGAEEPETIPVFADGSTVPTWAQGSMYALSAAGIFKGTGSGNISPNDVLNRAQTAQILLSVKKIYG